MYLRNIPIIDLYSNALNVNIGLELQLSIAGYYLET